MLTFYTANLLPMLDPYADIWKCEVDRHMELIILFFKSQILNSKESKLWISDRQSQ